MSICSIIELAKSGVRIARILLLVHVQVEPLQIILSRRKINQS